MTFSINSLPQRGRVGRKAVLKNGRNYPAEWKDQEIKGELKTLSDHINQYKAGESDSPKENLILDAFNYYLGHSELQNRKTSRISFLLALLAMVVFGVATETAWLGYVIYKNGEHAEKTQKANVDTLLLIEKHLKNIAGDIADMMDSLLEDDTDPEPLNPEQPSPLFNET